MLILLRFLSCARPLAARAHLLTAGLALAGAAGLPQAVAQDVRPTVAAPSNPPATASTVAQPATEAVRALQVVLLLPLENAILRRAATSVRDGAAAVFATRKREVNLRDCSYAADGVAAAYARCVDERVDWVIGPLGRIDVAALALAKLPAMRPTLMLSPLGTVPPHPLAVLAPELEAEGEAIAQQAVEDACRRPVLIEASGALAGRVNVAITAYWRERIATPLTQHRLGNRDSWRRVTEGWRRDNVDCVLFAGGGSVLVELRPYLRGIAIYTTSASYESELERTTDWTGVRIADAPWLIDAERAEFAAFMPAVATSPTLSRLYALGVDAARLVLAAGRDTLPPAFDGAIGQLVLKDAQYRRQPMIGEFRERNLVKVGP